jgi:hypothetical protein
MRIVSMFLCLSLGFAAAHAQLKIDFTVTNGAVEPGYQGYFAGDKNTATFTAQSYAAFGTAVAIKPTWAPGAAAAAIRMIDRGTNDGIVDAVDMLRDWIGTDTRAVGDPMTLTISGLPVGVYQWLSYHHDAHDQTGIFAVTVNDAAGSAVTSDIDITNSTGTTIKSLADVTKFTTKITSNGRDDVTLVFDQTSASSVTANAIFVMNAFELTQGEATEAIAPAPAIGATDVLRDGTILSWRPAKKAVSHDVYLGTDSDDIDDGTTAGAVYRGRQDANTFDPGRLDLGQTYYWRIDEIASDGTLSKGSVWNFTVEPVSIALGGDRITATASSFAPDSGPEKTINGVGLDPSDQHSTDLPQMWLTATGTSQPAWVQYDFDRAYKLSEMWVWNSNQQVESFTGFGAKNVTVEYSLDGDAWSLLGDVEFLRAPGTATYTHNTTVAFNGVTAKSVKLTIHSNWGGVLPQVGLSEVRFLVIPAAAREPSPASGATAADPRSVLQWRSGREAGTHRVYLSTDANEMINGTALVATVSQPQFDAGSLLTLGQRYYWKVSEVNDLRDPAVWDGDLWSFTVMPSLGIDDFESYSNDSPNRVFQHWIDGAGFSEDEFFPSGNPGNGSGALVGYDPTQGNIMETAIVHGGRQSMPFIYDRSVSGYSEAECTFDEPQDWTRFGAKALTLWFQGDPCNTATQMYVKVNSKKVPYNGNAGDPLNKPWHLWYIPLTELTGVDLARVTKLVIGFEGGQGTVFFDDIALSPRDRQLVTPVQPAPENLVARYAFEGNTNDSTGAHNATAVGAPTFDAGKVGQAIKLNGATDHVVVEGTFDLPEYSAAMWFRVDGGTGARDLLSIYSGTSHGVLLEVTDVGALRFVHRAPLGGSGGTDIRSNSKYADGAWYHLAIVKSATAATLYVNGVLASTAADSTQFDATLPRLVIGVLGHDRLSRYFPGAIDEVYLYNRALSQGEVASLAGRTAPFDDQ